MTDLRHLSVINVLQQNKSVNKYFLSAYDIITIVTLKKALIHDIPVSHKAPYTAWCLKPTSRGEATFQPLMLAVPT